MEVKKREILFSVIVILVMLLLGVFICNAITQRSALSAERYATATVITERDQFRYGMDTNFGNTLVYGDVTTDDPVTFREIGGGYIYIERIDEHYTRHTRTVTTTDSDGHTHTHTETYYTWDRVNWDDITVQSIRFLGEEFPYGTFRMEAERLDLSSAGVDNRWNYIYTSESDRSYYNVIPATVTGTVFANLQGGTMTETSSLYRDKTPDMVIESMQNAHRWQASLFWSTWGILIVLIVFAFVYQENRWLD